jgi:hypothetical protein
VITLHFAALVTFFVCFDVMKWHVATIVKQFGFSVNRSVMTMAAAAVALDWANRPILRSL